MKYKLIIRPRAEIDRTSHFLYLASHAPGAALNLDTAIEDALTRINANPKTGARLNMPDIEHLDLRFYRPKGFDRYLIVYRMEADRIFVTRILHSSQDIESALLIDQQ